MELRCFVNDTLQLDPLYKKYILWRPEYWYPELWGTATGFIDPYF
jgi:hypothetical protein